MPRKGRVPDRPWRPTREEIVAAGGRTVPDVIGPGLTVLLCGINPGLYSGAVGHHFARPGNRLWRTLHLAGFTDEVLSPFAEHSLLDRGVGITNLVARATATADQVTADELRAGAERVARKVRRHQPKVVAFLGLSAYRTAFRLPAAGVGPQDHRIGGAQVWLLPNPSGLNAHYQLPDLVAAFRDLAEAVGLGDHGEGLTETDIDPDPLVQFDRWYRAAFRSGAERPDAMALATATAEGTPSVRMVLLKGVDADGFVFFTNFGSQKGMEVRSNPRVAFVMHWVELQRQVRVVGVAERVTRKESERYFATRPREAQLAAWASTQSAVIAGRSALEDRYRRYEERFRGRAVPLPRGWGGIRIRPESIEFWQGRDHRLHDRLRYRRDSDGEGWIVERLAP